MGFGPATGPTLKTALCHIRALVGSMIKNQRVATRISKNLSSAFKCSHRENTILIDTVYIREKNDLKFLHPQNCFYHIQHVMNDFV